MKAAKIDRLLHLRRYARSVSNIEKRSGARTPRRVRERRAYRLVVGGSTAGAVGVVAAALAIIGVIGWTLPILALIIAAICLFSFRGMTRPS